MRKILMLFAFLCSLGLHTLYAQGQKVTGKVSDTEGMSIPGVSVVVKGTTIGVITNVDGEFAIEVPSSTSTLTFSFVGMETQEISVGSKTQITAVLKTASTGLDEVVVVGYGSQKKVNLTGAVSSIKMEDVLKNRPVNTVGEALQGSVPGLTLTNGTGQPGSGFTFNIRGVTSINSGKPLILVDNVAMDLSMIDPNDIESVSVLKDAASTAIYGARAAFGVILITTKGAEFNKKTTLRYTNNFSFTTPESLPQKGSIRETIRVARAMGHDPYPSSYDLDTWEAELDKYEADPSLFPNGMSEVGGILYSLKEYDMFDDMMDDFGFRQKHNITISGGENSLAYRVSLGHIDENGILVTSKDSYKRDNVSTYLKTNVTDWFKAEFDVKYANSEKTTPGTGSNGLWGNAVMTPSYAPTGISTINDEPIPYQTSRNYIELDGVNTTRKYDVRLFGKTTMTPFKGFSLTSEWTYRHKTMKKESYRKKYTTLNGRTFQEKNSRDNSRLTINNQLIGHKTVNIYASYKFKLSDLGIKVMGGVNHEEYDEEYMTSIATGMMNDELPSLTSGQETPVQSDAYSQYAVRGYFFRTNFNYDDKYLVEVNGRYDGSSRFPSDNRFGFFPSVSLGWRLSEEDFMESTRDIVSNLKLRASYGSVGNQNIGNYDYIPAMSAYETNWIVGEEKSKSLYAPGLVSNSFTWEEVRTLDFGLDVSLFDSKFNTSFDWYKRETLDMLAAGMEVPAVLGTASPKQNVADLESYGWEFQMNWRDQIGEDFRYNIGFNIFDSNAKITKFDNKSKLLSSHYVGQKLGDIWGYTTDRFYTTDDFNDNGTLKEGIPFAKGVEVMPGDILYVDYDGDGEINNGDNTLENSGDKRVIGNNKRHYQYGITAGLGWKNFNLSLFFNGVGKQDVWQSSYLIFPHNKEYGTIYQHQLDYWTPENTDAFYARPRYKERDPIKKHNQNVQTKYLLNGAFIRLKNISLSYSVPQNILSKVGLSQMRIHVAGENLWSKHHFPEGLTPDMVYDGTQGWNYPFMKKYSFGIDVSF